MISFSQKIWFYSVTAKHNTKPYRKERKSIMKKRLLALGLAAVLGANIAGTSAVWAADKVEITNVSYDPTRELYEQYNKVFAEHWKEQTGQEVEVTQSHGGSGKQALEVAISEQIKISPGRTAGPLHRRRFFAENNLFIHDKRSFHCRSCNGSFHKVLRL